MSRAPATVPGGFTFAALGAGFSHTCGITSTGAACCWGGHLYGQLGDGTTTDRTSPMSIQGGFSFAAVSAADARTCGLTIGDVPHCWGENYKGQIGDGTSAHWSVPCRLTGLARARPAG